MADIQVQGVELSTSAAPHCFHVKRKGVMAYVVDLLIVECLVYDKNSISRFPFTGPWNEPSPVIGLSQGNRLSLVPLALRSLHIISWRKGLRNRIHLPRRRAGSGHLRFFVPCGGARTPRHRRRTAPPMVARSGLAAWGPGPSSLAEDSCLD